MRACIGREGITVTITKLGKDSVGAAVGCTDRARELRRDGVETVGRTPRSLAAGSRHTGDRPHAVSSVDIHAHWFPRVLAERFRALGAPTVGPIHPSSLARCIEELESSDVELQVLGLGHNQPDISDVVAASAAARFANDVYADAVRDEPRLGVFGAIPLPHAAAAIAEAQRCLDELGFQGIGVGTTSLGRSLDDPSYRGLWALLDEREAVVFVHPVGTADTFTPGMDHPLIGPTFGGPHEAGLATLHMIQDDLPGRFPRIQWVVAATGGTFSLLWRRFEDIGETAGLPEALGDDVVRRIRGLYYDTTLTDDPAVLRAAVRTFGIDRIVLGTDSPRASVADWMERTRRGLGVTQVEWDHVRGGTMRELLLNMPAETAAAR